MARLFFAVWPEPRAARELALVGESLAELAGGKPMPAEKIHVTLAFLGSVDPEEAATAVDVAGRMKGGPIEMAMEQVGSFRRAKVGWAAPTRAPATLMQLQAALEAGLRARGFRLDERDFNPHATLVRKIARPIPAAPMPAVEWRSRTFTLVESTGDGRYEVLESWE